MKDLLLDKNGDLVFTNGDVSFTDSVVQAITIRLRWFFGEWKIFEKARDYCLDDIDWFSGWLQKKCKI